MQTVATQMSPSVQTLPSSQGNEFAVCTQPPVKSQASLVHVLPSSQAWVLPTHAPDWHVSLMVQALPSSHGKVFGV